MDELKLSAFKLDQFIDGAKSIYLAKITAKELVEDPIRFQVRYYERIQNTLGGYKDTGYQRHSPETKINKIVEFILSERKGKPEFPTSIVACTQNRLEFKDDGKGVGTLVIKPPLYIVDGQHRFEAWKRLIIEGEGKFDYLEKYEMPIVILSGFEEIDEVLTFYIINSRQTKVKTDLAHRHYIKLASSPSTKHIVKNVLWIVRANKVANLLNEDMEGVWKGLMLNANEPKDSRYIKPISVSAFAMSLRPFYSLDSKEIFEKTAPGGIEADAGILDRFWKIVGDVWPEPFQEPKRFTLAKTVGVYSLHYLFASILRKSNYEVGTALSEVKKILSNAKTKFGPEFWLVSKELTQDQKNRGEYAGAYSSAQGHKQIVQMLTYPDMYR